MKSKALYCIILVLVLSFSGCNMIMNNQMTESVFAESTLCNAAESTQISGFDIHSDGSCYCMEYSKFPLYAQLKSENIYLYGIHPYGMVLYQNEKATYFDWPGITPRQILPELMYDDFNGDGNKELAVTIYWGSGTGYSMMDLHILEIAQLDDSYLKPTYTDHALLGKDVDKWLDKPITCSLSDDKRIVTIEFDDRKYSINYDINTLQDAGNCLGICKGDIVEFKFDQNLIKVSVGIGLKYEQYATCVYIGTIEATVNFTNNHFSLSNYQFTL